VASALPARAEVVVVGGGVMGVAIAHELAVDRYSGAIHRLTPGRMYGAVDSDRVIA